MLKLNKISLSIIIISVIGIILWNIHSKNRVSTMDFPSFYSASKVIGKDNIYNYKNLDIGIPKQDDHIYPYIYPPTFAYLFKSITFLKYYPAENTWIALNCLFYLMLLILLYEYGKDLIKNRNISDQNYNIFFLIAFLSSSYLFRYILILGQVDLFLTLLIFNSILIYPKNKSFSAFLLAISLMLKPIQVVLLFYFLVKKDFRFILYFTFFCIIILIGSIFLFGVTPWEDFLNFMKVYRETGFVEGLGDMNLPNYSLTNLLYRNIENRFVFNSLSYGFFFIITVSAAYKVTKNKTDNILLGIAPLFFIQPIFSTVTWAQHTIHFFPVVFVIALSYIDQKYLSQITFLLFFLTTVYWGRFVLMFGISNNIYAVTTLSMISLFVMSLFVKENNS